MVFGLDRASAGIVPDFIAGWRSNSTEAEDYEQRSEDDDHNFTQPFNGPIQPKNLDKIKQVKNCINREFILDQERKHFGTEKPSDYQLYMAQEVARCL